MTAVAAATPREGAADHHGYDQAERCRHHQEASHGPPRALVSLSAAFFQIAGQRRPRLPGDCRRTAPAAIFSDRRDCIANSRQGTGPD